MRLSQKGAYSILVGGLTEKGRMLRDIGSNAGPGQW
jgi:hypothetical protein